MRKRTRNGKIQNGPIWDRLGPFKPVWARGPCAPVCYAPVSGLLKQWISNYKSLKERRQEFWHTSRQPATRSRAWETPVLFLPISLVVPGDQCHRRRNQWCSCSRNKTLVCWLPREAIDVDGTRELPASQHDHHVN